MTGEWTEEKEKAILKRYRNTLTKKILQVVFALLILYMVYVLALNIAYDSTSKGDKLIAYTQLSLDWLYPGINSGTSPGFVRAEISPLMSQSVAIPFLRQIGGNEIEVGELQVEKPLFARPRIRHDIYTNMKPEFRFYLPVHPETNQTLSANQPHGVWETLDKVHEGTVADLAISTTAYMSPEDLIQLLEDLDIAISWMALYMGEFENFPVSWTGSGNSVSLINPWGLTHGSTYDDEYFRAIRVTRLSSHNIDEIKQMMLDNMRRLYQDDPKLAEAMFGPNFKERLLFLEEEGFVVYGAVVTGPTKELLRLRELEEIQGVHLGEVQLWNWTE
ncbi:anti-sigma factor [Dethiobacter alkaliphilus]|uniref:anti-sigma factor n=1 Tax=Dethiobacter alkaliphilus TaxID=427926 RepID=UPI002227D229|nr:anti-sigma factor [Dethiobacter alkaliphilus]MCW3491650.1 anti-sigma factor [Dethiobacter alkaliphilus]